MSIIGVARYGTTPAQSDRKDTWSVRVSGNWRITFKFIDGDAEILNLEDYH